MNARVDFLAELPAGPARIEQPEYRPVVVAGPATSGLHQVSTRAQLTDADARHLRGLMLVVGLLALLVGVAVLAIFLRHQPPRYEYGVTAVALGLLGATLLTGRARVERANVSRAAAGVSIALLALVIVVALGGNASPTLALTTITAVLVAVPYVDRSSLMRLGALAWAGAIVVALLHAASLPAQPNGPNEGLVRFMGVSIQTGIALFAIVHLSGRLTSAAQRYRDLFQRVPVGMYRSTPDGRFLDVNGAFIEMFGFRSTEELTAVDAAELYAEPGDRLDFQEAVSQAGVVRSIEYRARRSDGGVFWVRDSAMLIRDASGQPVYYEGIVEDVTEHRHHQLKLEHRASVDAVTGLTNRAVLLEMLDASLAAASPERPVALLFVDLDEFKQVNDRYGHTSGDEVLVEVGRRLREATREADTIARYGGDEFVVVLGVPTGEVVAEAVADRVIGQFDRPFGLASGSVNVGASVGVAVAHEPIAAGELIERADKAMYGAKRRSRVLAARD